MKKNETNTDKNKFKTKYQKEAWQNKKLDQINEMSDEELVNVLKTKCLPTFGTKSERAD